MSVQYSVITMSYHIFIIQEREAYTIGMSTCHRHTEVDHDHDFS